MQFVSTYKKNEKNPFYIVPWEHDFLYSIQELVNNFTQRKENPIALQNIVLVFPNTRPKRYLTERYKREAKKTGKATLLPQILTSSEFYKLCLNHFERGKPLFSELEPLDRYAKFFHIVKDIFTEKNAHSHFYQTLENSYEESIFASQDTKSLQMTKFYPWAVSLDSLFEECFQHCIMPQNILYTEGEVSLFASNLLEELKEIYTRYLAELEQERHSTRGYEMFKTAEYIRAYTSFCQTGEYATELPYLQNLSELEKKEYFQNITPLLLKDKLIIFAGFVHLTEAENSILQHFWQKGACIALHTDSKLVLEPKALHYSCSDHSVWLKKWQAEAVLAFKPTKEKTRFHLISGYDVHSQLEQLKKDLLPIMETIQKNEVAEDENSITPQKRYAERDDNVAVVLPTSSLLMPVLHELPTKNINISLGYPVKRTLLWQFIELVLSLQLEKKQEEYSQEILYSWTHFNSLLHHPYTKMLLNADSSVFTEWRKFLYKIDGKMQAEKALFSIESFEQVLIEMLDIGELSHEVSDILEDFLQELFQNCIYNFENANTLQSLAQAIENLLSFLVDNGGAIWERFPLDKEALAMVLQNILPSLGVNALAQETFIIKNLYSILTQLIGEQRVPFEAAPLTGMQVLGMLETRLLRFDTLFLLDMTESNIPGAKIQDPLMPDSLRLVLGLPDSHSRERIMAHTIYRLIHGANDVYCYWQEGVPSSEIQSGKAMRSRFIEEIIWNMEKEKGAVLEKGKEILSIGSEPIAPKRRKKRAIEISQSIKNAIISYMDKGLYPTALNTFLACPAKFYYMYIAKVGELESVQYGDNARIIGNKVHTILRSLYEPYKGQEFMHTEEQWQRLEQYFGQEFNTQNWQECLDADSYFMMQNIGKKALKKYFETAPTFTPIALEERFHTNLALLKPYESLQRVELKGIADRIDKRNSDEYWIVDYKTGGKKSFNGKIWTDKDFLKKLGDAVNAGDWDSSETKELLEKLFHYMEDIQLPYYLYIYSKYCENNGEIKEKMNASWIFLRERKQENEVCLVPVNSVMKQVENDEASEEKKKSKEKVSEEEQQELVWESLKEIRENSMETILQFLLGYMLHAKEYACQESKACTYCPYKNYC